MRLEKGGNRLASMRWQGFFFGRHPTHRIHGKIVYLPTSTTKKQPNVGKYTTHGSYGQWHNIEECHVLFILVGPIICTVAMDTTYDEYTVHHLFIFILKS